MCPETAAVVPVRAWYALSYDFFKEPRAETRNLSRNLETIRGIQQTITYGAQIEISYYSVSTLIHIVLETQYRRAVGVGGGGYRHAAPRCYAVVIASHPATSNPSLTPTPPCPSLDASAKAWLVLPPGNAAVCRTRWSPPSKPQARAGETNHGDLAAGYILCVVEVLQYQW